MAAVARWRDIAAQMLRSKDRLLIHTANDQCNRDAWVNNIRIKKSRSTGLKAFQGALYDPWELSPVLRESGGLFLSAEATSMHA